MKNTLIVIMLVLSVVKPTSAQVVYNLATDWSDTSNPNGVWTYEANGNLLTSTIRTSDSWSTPQVSWGDLPGIFKSNGTEQFTHDWVAGDIITHTGDTEILWTSPFNGEVTISGDVWDTRASGRQNDWSLVDKSTTLTSGMLVGGDQYHRATPFLFSAGSGGASVLQDIVVQTGDVIQLDISPTGTGDYAGINLTITEVPEPAQTAWWIGLAAIGLVYFKVCQQTKSRV